MRKFFVFASAAILALASCAKEQEVVPVTDNDEMVVLTFKSNRPQIDGETKTAWNTNKIVWSEGDKIRVGYQKDGNWMGQSEPGTAKFYTSTDVSINGSNASVGTFNVPISGSAFTDPGVSGDYQFFAVYPSSAISSAEVANPASKNITLPANQTPGSNTFDKSADIMVGQSEVMSISGLPTDPIELTWTRLVAHADFTFSNLAFDGAETVSKITLTFNTEAKVAGSVTVNIPAGTAGVGNTNEIVLSGSNITSGDDFAKAWACVLPVTFTSLNVEVKTDKATYTREITGISKTFKQNARNTLTINMSKASRTEKTGQLVADGYYVISYDNYMMTVGTESDAYRGSDTKNVSDPDDDAIWKITFVSASDAYTIHSLGANKDLYGITSNNTTLTLGSGGTNLFTIEKSNSTASTYKIAPQGNTSRAIGYNTSSPRFALYAGSAQQPITLDLTSVTVTETPVITIADEEKTKEVEANATTVSFTYVPNMFATEAPIVAIASDSDGIINGISSVADGTITVNLNPNTENKAKTATLTVSGTGIASPITLRINQKAKTGEVYSYTFTSKSWAATRESTEENWTSGKDGSQMNNGGIQVTTSVTGANGTSPNSFTNVSKVVLTYCTNASSGAGSISVKVGNGTVKSNSVTKTGGTTHRTLEYTFSPAESGQVTITVTCTTNSIYLVGADITAASMEAPVAGISVATAEASNTSSTDGKTATLNGTITLNNGALIGDVSEAGFYYKADNGAYTKVTVDPSTSLSYNLTGLTPSTVTYTYYAYAVYGGNEETGEEKAFSTSKSNSPTSQQVTLQYTGTTTTNMTGNNDAATLGLDASKWSVVGAKGGNSNFPGLNKAHDIRLYWTDGDSNTLTVSSLVSGVTINNITINYTDNTYSNGIVLVGGSEVSILNGVYPINDTSFVITNGNTSNVQVRISSIVIDYTPSN